MSRSNYGMDGPEDAEEQWQLIRYRGAVASAIRGKRGQAFLNEMLAALDALSQPELIADELIQDGAVCGIGAVGKARGMDMTDLDAEASEDVAAAFGIADAMVKELAWWNDEGFFGGWGAEETPRQRFNRVRGWVVDHIRGET